jgi:hypothetical protein
MKSLKLDKLALNLGVAECNMKVSSLILILEKLPSVKLSSKGSNKSTFSA